VPATRAPLRRNDASGGRSAATLWCGYDKFDSRFGLGSD
jgi:hypothetical protein